MCVRVCVMYMNVSLSICMRDVPSSKRVGYVLTYMCMYLYEWECMNMCVREHESILCDYVCMFM